MISFILIDVIVTVDVIFFVLDLVLIFVVAVFGSVIVVNVSYVMVIVVIHNIFDGVLHINLVTAVFTVADVLSSMLLTTPSWTLLSPTVLLWHHCRSYVLPLLLKWLFIFKCLSFLSLMILCSH